MCKKRKEKKLNMQGKDNMVLDYFIIYTHATHEKREADTILPIYIAQRIHAARGEGLEHMLNEGKKEGTVG